MTGNLKFDVEPRRRRSSPPGARGARSSARPVVLLASTREGEEELLLAATERRRRAASSWCRAIARRFDEVAQWAQSRRSAQRAARAGDDRVHLGDTMGEMAFYYAACDVAVIGGSLRRSAART